MKFINKLLRDEQGATAIEYGLIAALIAVVLVTVALSTLVACSWSQAHDWPSPDGSGGTPSSPRWSPSIRLLQTGTSQPDGWLSLLPVSAA